MIRHNTFVDCQVGTWIGGGRRNTVVLNRYEKCDTAVHLDNRGTRGGAKRADQCDDICKPLSTGCTCNTGAAQWMATASSAAATWRARWPFLLSLRSERLGQPAYNNISSNNFCLGNFIDVSQNATVKWGTVVESNVNVTTCFL